MRSNPTFFLLLVLVVISVLASPALAATGATEGVVGVVLGFYMALGSGVAIVLAAAATQLIRRRNRGEDIF